MAIIRDKPTDPINLQEFLCLRDSACLRFSFMKIEQLPLKGLRILQRKNKEKGKKGSGIILKQDNARNHF